MSRRRKPNSFRPDPWRKAMLVERMDSATKANLDDLVERRLELGVSLWSLGNANQFLKTVRTDAPAQVQTQVRQLALNILTGKCPNCGGVANIEQMKLYHERWCRLYEIPSRHLVNPLAKPEEWIMNLFRVDPDGPVKDNGHSPDCSMSWPDDVVMVWGPGPRGRVVGPDDCPGNHDYDDDDEEDEGLVREL